MPVRLLAVIFPAHLRSTYSSAPAQTRFQQNLPTSPPDVFVSGQQAVRFGNSKGFQLSGTVPTKVMDALSPVNDSDRIARVRVTDKEGQSYDLILYFQGTKRLDTATEQMPEGPKSFKVTGYKTQDYEQLHGAKPLIELAEEANSETRPDSAEFKLRINPTGIVYYDKNSRSNNDAFGFLSMDDMLIFELVLQISKIFSSLTSHQVGDDGTSGVTEGLHTLFMRLATPPQ